MMILVRLESGPELGVGRCMTAAAAVHVGHAGVCGAGRQRAWNNTRKHVQKAVHNRYESYNILRYSHVRSINILRRVVCTQRNARALHIQKKKIVCKNFSSIEH